MFVDFFPVQIVSWGNRPPSCVDMPSRPWLVVPSPNIQNYPSIFSPNNDQHLCPRYLHHKKPIKAGEFRGEFHFRTLKPKKLLAVWCASTWLKVSHPFLTEYNATTKFTKLQPMATKPQGTTKNLGQFHFHVTSSVRSTFPVALLRYVVEITLEMHL